MCRSTELLLRSQSLPILLPNMPRHPGIHQHQIHLFTPLGFGLRLHGLTPHSIVNTERQNFKSVGNFFFSAFSEFRNSYRICFATSTPHASTWKLAIIAWRWPATLPSTKSPFPWPSFLPPCFASPSEWRLAKASGPAYTMDFGS